MQLASFGRVHNHFYEQINNLTQGMALHIDKASGFIRAKKPAELEFILSLSVCGLFQNRAVASTGYVLRVRFLATERCAETPHFVLVRFTQKKTQQC